jgi:hypothetical protein
MEEAHRKTVPDLPKDAAACYALGASLARAGDVEAALIPLRQAARLAGDNPQYQNYLALVLEMSGHFDEAIDWHRKVLAMAHANAQKFNMTGNARLALSQMHYHLAFALELAGKLRESEEHYRRAIELNPVNFAAQINYPMVQLKLNHFEKAWQGFFGGLALTDAARSAAGERKWDGSNLSGKRILVSATGSYGDTILLARFLPILRQRGARVFLQCKPALLALLGPLVDETAALDSPPPEYDFYAPLATLPLNLGFTSPPDPTGCPYLSPPADRRDAWASRVRRDGVMNIGLVWAGSAADQSRFHSHTIDVFAPLASAGRARFFSLQKGYGSDQKHPDGMGMYDFSPELRDFADTAALVERLDLVIGVDTSVIHLAGALNKPAWALVPWRSYFIWLLDRSDSPWYPSVRLFRQTRPNDWQTPARAMADALTREISQRK